MKREALGAAAALAAGLVALLLVASVGGLGLLWPDELDYAVAARELGAGRRPLSFDTSPQFVRRYGFPHAEPHAPGGAQSIRAAFAVFGPSEAAALVPAMTATLALVLVAYAVSRGAGLEPRRALAATALLAALPQVAGFAATAFTEPTTTLAAVLGAAALVARRPASRTALAVVSVVLGVACRETALAIPCALALGLAAGARREGASGRAAIAAGLPGVAALGVGLLVLASSAGVFAGHATGDLLGWSIARPILPGVVYRDGFPTPAVTASLVLERALAQAPRLVWCTRPVAGSGLALVLVHVAALGAASGLRRGASAAARGLASYALALYLVKMLFLLFIYEEPGLNARHLAPDTAVLVLAAAASLGGSKTRWWGALVALVPALLALDVVVAHERALGRATLGAYTDALVHLADPRPGQALVASGAHRVPWERPGTFAVLPPATEGTLEWLAERVPIQAVVLNAQEPLVGPTLERTGRLPPRLGRFELVRREQVQGLTLLLYEPPTHPPR